jgi:hypothetical protein
VAEADGYRTEKQVFRFSLYYLFLHFGAFLAEAALKPFGLGAGDMAFRPIMKSTAAASAATWGWA